MNGKANRTRLIQDDSLDALADPPDGVGRKRKPRSGSKLLYGPHKTEISFLDQIREGKPAVEIAMRDLDHQSQVTDDHTLACGIVTVVCKVGETDLFLGRQKSGAADLIEVQPYRIEVAIPRREPTRS